ncbi:MAG: glycosyltransferase family 4 protein [Prevotella sp.]|nr:glycosyltransferase family 4 protein [Prevotella sp.]
MKVLIVNTSERTGGAAVAANRLMKALNNNGAQAKMLVRDKETDDLTVVALPKPALTRWHFLWERFVIFAKLHFSRQHLFDIDIANSGTDITRLREFREADIIHLHWVNQGMLSLSNIRKILRSGKPVVWTMHDIWPATAICHLTLGCRNFTTQCQQCKYLPGGGSTADLAASVWKKKQKMVHNESIYYVACSRWLEAEAKSSALLRGQKITSVPNPIDTRLFAPRDKQEARRQLGLPLNKRLILFVSQRATNPYKGIDYLVSACQIMARVHGSSATADNTAILILGGHAEEVAPLLPFQAIALGYVGNEQQIVSIYSAADVFVLPSLSENLPNTIMEAMACGVPCVAFNVGGIPEQIDHRKNGYLAKYRNADDLAEGLRWVLFQADGKALSNAARSKVLHTYSQQAVAIKYLDLYHQAMAFNHYKL